MTSWKLELIVSQDMIPAIEETLFALAESDPLQENWPTFSDFEIREGENMRQFEAFYAHKPDERKIRETLAACFRNSGRAIPEIQVQALEEKDWVSESQKLLHPVDTGRFFVYGSHDADKVPENRLALLIEAGQAFGTGQHETTHSCLRALADLADQGRPDGPVLDLGCGSGVLALAMAKLWQIPVMASDIDPVATATTLENARVNRISGITAITCEGFADPQLSANGPYGLIVANILAGPLIELAPEVARHLAPNGTVILSGLLDKQEQDVRHAYEKQNLRFVRSYALNEWRALVLHRA
ncbi:50S ribosomal protein L11 methyltransferase [Luteithermobacter gelatinilyticus]|uniref:50S ribosomal protein L11 methyltransferase n=1 Tax=Luteithermobacter gelatinilyticus TaxID=2582913 RepID=UPI001106BDCF|nr:50S ribosomal protein L11 methyltransferase [Luteithermobacter gelatinilyticus]